MPLRSDIVQARLVKKYHGDISRSVEPMLRDGNYIVKVTVELIPGFNGKSDGELKTNQPTIKDSDSLLPGLPVDVNAPGLPDLVELDARDEDLVAYVRRVRVELVLDKSAAGGSAALLSDTIHSAIDPLALRKTDDIAIRYENLAAYRGLLSGKPVRPNDALSDEEAITQKKSAEKTAKESSSGEVKSVPATATTTGTNNSKAVYGGASGSVNQTTNRTASSSKTTNIVHNHPSREQIAKREREKNEKKANAPFEKQATPKPLSTNLTGSIPKTDPKLTSPLTETVISTPELKPDLALPTVATQAVAEPVPGSLKSVSDSPHLMSSPVLAAVVLVFGIAIVTAIIFTQSKTLHDRLLLALDSVIHLPRTLSETVKTITKAISDLAVSSGAASVKHSKVQNNDEPSTVLTPSIAPTISSNQAIDEVALRRDLIANPASMASFVQRKLGSDAASRNDAISVLCWLGAKHTREVARRMPLEDVQKIAAAFQGSSKPILRIELLHELQQWLLSKQWGDVARIQFESSVVAIINKLSHPELAMLLQKFDIAISATLLSYLTHEQKEGAFVLLSPETRSALLPAISSARSVDLLVHAKTIFSGLGNAVLASGRSEQLPQLLEEAHRYMPAKDLQELVSHLSAALDSPSSDKAGQRLQMIKS